ncbi:IS110 family transposase [Parafrankia sp. BMG5.11]|uniref:IS110 family transposase n=1 Tax=Parafrankia sp. BMG5.11 TaxID=222540 RepID=UPI001039A66A|nr:IS110 family transposase [Parafrankia sp. BMG5.11]TCJ39101.1 IS110 family transposase [Parafrankia sp. BMG5.11]
MSHFAFFVGLDVSPKRTAICIVDTANSIVAEAYVPTNPEAIARFVRDRVPHVERVGLEAGQMSEWLTVGLNTAGLPTICVEARHAQGFIQSQINKSDRNDARGLARMMMCGVYKPVHVKSLESMQLRALLGARKIVLEKMIDIELHIRGTLKTFGHQLGSCGRAQFAFRVDELAEDNESLQLAIRPLLRARDGLNEQYERLHYHVLGIVRDDPVCRLLMTAPGVGPVTALTFKTAVDDPERLQGSKSVGALFGMTPRRHQSGDTDRMGSISKWGGQEVRSALVEAGMRILTTVKQPSLLRTQALELEARIGRNKAAVALGRRLGSILRRMWLDQRAFDPNQHDDPGAA